MTRSEAIRNIADIIFFNREEFADSYMVAKRILDYIDRERMSTHQADEWEPEVEKE